MHSRVLVGVAIDVSASMSQSLRNDAGRGLSRFDSVRQVLEVITTRAERLMGAAAAPLADRPQVDVFAYIFGLRNLPGYACDLFSLLSVADRMSNTVGAEQRAHDDPYDFLKQIADQHGRGGWGGWITEHIGHDEAVRLAANLHRHPSLGRELGRLLPDFSTDEIKYATAVKDLPNKSIWERVKETFRLGRSLREGQVSPVRLTNEVMRSGGVGGVERQIRQAQKLLAVLSSDLMSEAELFERFRSPIGKMLWRQLDEIGDVTLPIEQVAAFLKSSAPNSRFNNFIYGNTPLRNVMNKVHGRLRRELAENDYDHAYLLVISDGEPTDGDPLPTAHSIQRMGVHIVSCFVSNRDLQEPRTLPAKQARNWTRGARLLYKMASPVAADSPYARRLVAWGWNVPPGARSFGQLNHSKILTEFLRAAIG